MISIENILFQEHGEPEANPSKKRIIVRANTSFSSAPLELGTFVLNSGGELYKNLENLSKALEASHEK